MGTLIYFHTLCKNCHKMSTYNSVGTNEELIEVDSCTKFAVNLMNIQGVITFKKKQQTTITATG